MKKIAYSEHALKRMKQRGVTELELEHVLKYYTFLKKTFEGRKEAVGTIKNRLVKVVFVETENYLKVITII